MSIFATRTFTTIWIRFSNPNDCHPSALNCSVFCEVLTISSLLKRKHVRLLCRTCLPIHLNTESSKTKTSRAKEENKTTAYSKRGLYSVEVLTCDFKEI